MSLNSVENNQYCLQMRVIAQIRCVVLLVFVKLLFEWARIGGIVDACPLVGM